MFTWVPMYKELAQRIITYRKEQQKLIEILKSLKEQGVPVISLEDENEKGVKSPLTEIDPFSFYATFNRTITEENRKKILIYIKDQLGLTSNVPEDFDGIPTAQAQNSLFFPYAYQRKQDDVDSLWTLAEEVVTKDELNGKLFDKCLKIKQVGLAKLTDGLFWLAPDRFLPVDSKSESYLTIKGIPVKVFNFESYSNLLDQVKKKLGDNFIQISYLAYLESKEHELIAKILEKEATLPFNEWKAQVDTPIKPFFKKLSELLTNTTSKLGKFSTHKRSPEGDDRLRTCITRANWKFLSKPLPFKDTEFNFQVQLGDHHPEKEHTITWGLSWWGSAQEAEYVDKYLNQIENRLDYSKEADSGLGTPGTTIRVIKGKFTPTEIRDLDAKYDLKEHIVKDLSSLADELEIVISGTDEPKVKPKGSLLEKKKQIILYGPPGTGKTYNTRSIAVDICEGERKDG